MFAYAMLGAATVMAIYLLWFKKPIDSREMDLCDNLTYVGLAFMTLGMLSGLYGQKRRGDITGRGTRKRHGRPLRGSPYLIYIHFRLGKPLLHREALILLLISFVLLQMCWYGINYLPSAQGVSIHTYNLN